ncbi:hydroxymethylglutaryl-CoA lyase [Comamonas odontotermitis]|uniref:hydroxymethylglutaryl-CoA lyase n=1 Tax=Comamonas odontotermitis TaxID=379895 RepID=UPI00375384B7
MRTTLPQRVEIHEEGPREGFQIERPGFSISQRASLVEALAQAGMPQIQVASFVNPTRVPQMADAPELFRAIRKRKGVRYTGLWLNEKGFERACSVAEVDLEGVLYFYASDTFCQRNNGVSSTSYTAAQKNWVQRYAAHDIAVHKCYVMTAFGCNFEGAISLQQLRVVLQGIVDLQAEAGIHLQELYLADTVGWANPRSVTERVDLVRELFPGIRVGLHLHDTRGIGMANALAGLQAGVDLFDASVAGLGGCPFSGHSAGGAAGNICSEDLVFLCHELGIETGIDLKLLIDAARLAEQIIGRRLEGHSMHSGLLCVQA